MLDNPRESSSEWPQVRFTPRRLAHVNAFVADLETTDRFYTEIVGLERVRTETENGISFYSNGATHHDLGLVQSKAKLVVRGREGFKQASTGRGDQPGLNHLGWEMHSEAELVEKLRAGKSKGLRTKYPSDHQLSHAVYLVDPENNFHELFADVTEDWRAIFNPDRNDLVTGAWDWENTLDPRGPTHPDWNDKRRVESAVFHPFRLARAVLAFEDPEKMDSFLTRVLGCAKISSNEGVAAYGSAESAYDLLVVPAEKVSGGPLIGFSLLVEDADDLEASIVRAKETGAVEIAYESNGPSKKSAVIFDPDGVAIEFYHPKGEDKLTKLPVAGEGEGDWWVFDY